MLAQSKSAPSFPKSEFETLFMLAMSNVLSKGISLIYKKIVMIPPFPDMGQSFSTSSTDHIPSNFLKAVLHKFYLVHS